MNVFITGINQIEDVEIDRLNKPWLPIAAGDLSLEAARRIVAVAAVAPSLMAVTQGAEELVAVGLALAIGWAYSCPPLRLKRYAALAAGSITFVRSLVVNLGVWLHFAGTPVSAGVWALIAVTVPFSFAIAVLKDVPDIEGDRRFGIATFSVRLGPRPVLAVGRRRADARRAGMAIAGPLLLDDANAAVLVVGHLLGVAALWRWALRVDPTIPSPSRPSTSACGSSSSASTCSSPRLPDRLDMRFIQHKAEARWFYRVVSLGYDRWINPLFWTAPMRDRALALARLDDPGLEVVDVGAGTGFATEAIVRTVAPDRVTMLDQSPHQLARARRKRALAGVTKCSATPRRCPSRPTRATATSRPGASSTGPTRSARSPRPTACCAPAGSRCWRARCGARTRWRARCRTRGCCSPARTSTSRGSSARASRRSSACTSPPTGGTRAGTATAWRSPPSSRGPASRRRSPAAAAAEDGARVTPARLARFAAGSLAGATFIPVALWFTLVRKLRRS